MRRNAVKRAGKTEQGVGNRPTGESGSVDSSSALFDRDASDVAPVV
jgi:hypothetical protein